MPQTIRRARRTIQGTRRKRRFEGPFTKTRPAKDPPGEQCRGDNARDNVALRGVRKGLDEAREILMMDQHTR